MTMESSSATSSNSIAKGAMPPPILTCWEPITDGSLKLLKVIPDSWMGWFPQLLKACLSVIVTMVWSLLTFATWNDGFSCCFGLVIM